jgi:hypothetical protein
MANISKKEVIRRLGDFNVIIDGITDYKVLCGMLREVTTRVPVEETTPEPVVQEPSPEPEPIVEESMPTIIHLESRIPKRNTFLADAVRDDRDAVVLNTELRNRIHKGKVVKIVTTKYAEVTADGDWLTEFDIELKG